MTAKPMGRRALNRVARHSQLMAAATEIFEESGLAALTMQAVAERVDCAVGTIYTYFDSKSALLAELQVEAIKVLTSAIERSETVWDREIAAAELDEGLAALVRLVAASRMFVDAKRLHPREYELLQNHISGPEQVINDVDTLKVLPQVLMLLGHPHRMIDAAVAVGALSTGSRMGDDDSSQTLRRTLRWAGGLNGAMLVSNAPPDSVWLTADMLDGRRLAFDLADDLLLAWGAPPRTLLLAKEFVDDLESRDQLLRSGADLDPEDVLETEPVD